MKFIVRYTKNNSVYSEEEAPNKAIVQARVSKFRNDAVINAFTDKSFSFEETSRILNNCKQVPIDWEPNTYKEFFLYTPLEEYLGSVSCNPDHLEEKLRESYGKNGFVLTLKGVQTFLTTKKNKPIPVLVIFKYKLPEKQELPKLAEGEKVEEEKPPIHDTEMKFEIVK